MLAIHARAMILAGLVAAVLAAPALAQAPSTVAVPAALPSEPDAVAVRHATERFRDVSVALAEGYIADPSGMCITSEMEGQPRQLGAMGIHYFRPGLLGITATAPRVNGTGTHTDFATPAVLIYEPQEDGSLHLVAVENLVFQKAWKDGGKTAPPSFQGNEYYAMVDNGSAPQSLNWSEC
jgi:hypothetical protein